MKTSSVKGTCDYLPKEAKLRDYIQGKILSTYTSQGFERISTPILEDIQNLEHSDGGDNLSLIFKVLKRGEKLQEAIDNGQDLSDMGLRYDLTLPLCRFYSEHKAFLPSPFKVIQIDRVYRAERPQKGRNREFVQCDIDILGSDSINCEVELIDTTASALLSLGLDNFTIVINDRRLLKKILAKCGFEEKDFDSVCITFDKLDKIGIDGVERELLDKNFDRNVISSFIDFVKNMPDNIESLFKYIDSTTEIDSLKYIMGCINELSQGKYKIKLDLSLVRGQGYYTGTIYEIRSDSYHCSIGGGGRYDNLIAKFTGESVPAVGFSIGFERIFEMLKDGIDLNTISRNKLAILYEEDEFLSAMLLSKKMKENYDVALYQKAKKLGKQLSRLEESGVKFYSFCDGQVKMLNKTGE